MRRILFLLLSVAGLAVNAGAQLTVQIRIEPSMLLVYESIPVAVNIHNISGRPITLEDTDESRWLRFLVTNEANDILPATGKLGASAPIIIPPGKAVSQTIDLLPLFALGSRGSYRVQATINSPAGNAVSAPIQFSLMHGRELWTQIAGLPGSKDEYRTYALVTRREGNHEVLFASVREDPAHVMYSLVPLGGAFAPDAVQAKVDKQACLHVLHQNGPRSYSYAQIDTAAKLSHRAAYSDFVTQPNLTETDGIVTVIGGEQTYPKIERILTDAELNPPPPPPAPKPKKKWFWSADPTPKPTDTGTH